MQKSIRVKIKGYYNKILTLYKKKNFLDIFLLVCFHIPNWLFCFEKSRLLSLQGSGKELKRTSTNYLFRGATLSDIPALLKCSGRSEDRAREDEFKRYFLEGNFCYLIEYGQQVVAYCWALNTYKLFFDKFKNCRIQLLFNEETVFFWDGYINPSHRLKGFFPILMKEITEDLRNKHNKQRFLADIYLSNEISFRSHISFGFTLIKTYYYISIFGINFLIISDLNKKRNILKIKKNMKLPV